MINQTVPFPIFGNVNYLSASIDLQRDGKYSHQADLSVISYDSIFFASISFRTMPSFPVVLLADHLPLCSQCNFTASFIPPTFVAASHQVGSKHEHFVGACL